MKDNQTLSDRDSQKSTLDKYLEDIGWGLFLIATGCILLVPAQLVPNFSQENEKEDRKYVKIVL
jgi:hypothetical protein